MEYKFKAGQRVRILDVESLGGRKEWAGREVTLKQHDSDGWDEPGWSVEEPDCYYRFRESEMAPLGPIRTEMVTVRRLEPGVYGPLRIWREISIPDCERPDETPVREVEVSFAATNIDENGIELRSLNASEWRGLARVALEIAEYLENA